MKVSLDYPDSLDAEIMKEARADGHENRSAVIRKALSFYLSRKSHKVAQPIETTQQKTQFV